MQELSRLHALQHAHYGRLHVVEDYGLASRVEVFDQRLYALEIEVGLARCYEKYFGENPFEF